MLEIAVGMWARGLAVLLYSELCGWGKAWGRAAARAAGTRKGVAGVHTSPCGLRPLGRLCSKKHVRMINCLQHLLL